VSAVDAARLMFYAVATFFLGCIVLAFNPPFGGENMTRVILALTLGVPLLFVGMAGYQLIRPRDRR
jgi:hypothetical protein